MISGRWLGGKAALPLDAQAPGTSGFNLGVRGDGLERVAARLQQEFSVRGSSGVSASGMLLGVGLNDCARVGRSDGRLQLEPEAFLFEQLLSQAVQLAPVFVLGLTPVNEEAMPYAGCLWYGNGDVARANPYRRSLP